MILQALVAGVNEVQRRQDSHVAVNLGHRGFRSRDGLDFFKVHSKQFADCNVVQQDGIFFPHLKPANAGVASTGGGRGEELMGRSSNHRFQEGGFAARGNASASQLQQIVSADASTGDKDKKGEKPNVGGSQVAQHSRISRGKADAI
jgi:hypothetical protein